VNTLLVAAGGATAEAPVTVTVAATGSVEDWRRKMTVAHRLSGGRTIVHSPAARWCDLCEPRRG
jgi:hypothetical protein